MVMKKNKASEQPISPLYLYEIHVAAFLQSKGVNVELKKEGTRVIFCFPNSTITHSLIEDYYSNPTVKLVDFVSHLRRLRSQMLSLRGQK